MSLYVSYPQQSLKRARYDNDAVNNISQKFARIDQLTVQEARKVFLESNSFDFQKALELETTGNLSNIHALHKRAEELLDSTKRSDRAVLRHIKRIPDALPVEDLVSPEQMTTLQNYFETKNKVSKLINHVYHKRIDLEKTWDIDMTIHEDEFTIESFVSPKKKEIFEIYKSILEKVVRSICELDQEKAHGAYKVEFFITRIFEEFNTKNNFPLHHDQLSSEKPSTFPRYTFVGMLSDKKGPQGWKGGDLIIQKDNKSKCEVGFKKHLPNLRYEYKQNEGLLLQNQKNVHQVTSIKSSNNKMARDLLQIRFFETSEL